MLQKFLYVVGLSLFLTNCGDPLESEARVRRADNRAIDAQIELQTCIAQKELYKAVQIETAIAFEEYITRVKNFCPAPIPITLIPE